MLTSLGVVRLGYWAACGIALSSFLAACGDDSGASSAAGGSGSQTGGTASGGSAGLGGDEASGGVDASGGTGDAPSWGGEAGAGSGGVSATCGDAQVDADEACDDGEDSDECDGDCSDVACGDTHVNVAAGEECEGELYFEDGSTSIRITASYCLECRINVCGDGVRLKYDADGIEVCSSVSECSAAEWPDAEDCDSFGADSAECDFDCSEVECGDGYTNILAGEQCDDGNDNPADGCDENCLLQ